MKISSIDVGSNAIRQIIVEINTEEYKRNPYSVHWKTLKKFRIPLRLGTDVFKDKTISGETLTQLCSAFKQMADLNKKYKADHVICSATSALRDASNQKDVVSKVFQASKIRIEVINGKKEADLIRQAIIKSNILNLKKSLLIDIGGGSLELTSIIDQQITHSVSYPLGVVRLKELSKKPQFNLDKHAQKYMSSFKKLAHSYNFQMAIGTGGNFDSLSKLKVALLKKTPQTNLTLKEIKQIQQKWKKLSHSQKLKLPIRTDRIDVFDIALALIIQTMETYQITRLKIPGTGLKEGLIYSLIG